MTAGARLFDPASADGTFHIAMTDYTEFVLLRKLMQHLQGVAPGINIAIKTYAASTRGDDWTDGETDLAIADFRAGSRRLRSRELFRERFVCITRQNNHRIGRR